MNLSAAHYDAILREYDDQRLKNMHDLHARTQEVYERFPEIKQIDGQISDLAENFASSFTSEGVMTFEEYRRKLADLRMEKEALMKCYHISPEALQMQYRCPDCQDTGYIENEKCHCFRQRIIDEMYQQSNLREILKAENFSTLTYKYYDEENLEQMKVAVETCRNFAENFDKTFENILLCGTVGIGKTFLSNCIAKECIEKGKIDEQFHTHSTIDDLYSYVRIEDIDDLNEKAGLKRIKMFAVDGAANYMRPVLKKMDEETFELFLKYQLSVCERSDMMGASSHVVDVIKK